MRGVALWDAQGRRVRQDGDTCKSRGLRAREGGTLEEGKGFGQVDVLVRGSGKSGEGEGKGILGRGREVLLVNL